MELFAPALSGATTWHKKGQTYGTILLDLHQNRVSLTYGRGVVSKRLKRGLNDTPEVHTVTSDRASAHALDIRKGAPQAKQVADRFHLLVSLRETLDRAMQRQSETIKKILRGLS